MSVIEQSRIEIPAGTWAADPAHSAVEFSVRYMSFTTVKGRARAVAATLDATGTEPKLSGKVDVAALTTHSEDRDAHLGSPDFFDAARHPEITFRSTRFEGDKVIGELTIKGVTREVELNARVTGTGGDPWGGERLGLDVEGEIDRNEFDLQWNAPLPGGGVLLDDKVELWASFSFVKQA